MASPSLPCSVRCGFGCPQAPKYQLMLGNYPANNSSFCRGLCTSMLVGRVDQVFGGSLIPLLPPFYDSCHQRPEILGVLGPLSFGIRILTSRPRQVVGLAFGRVQFSESSPSVHWMGCVQESPFGWVRRESNSTTCPPFPGQATLNSQLVLNLYEQWSKGCVLKCGTLKIVCFLGLQKLFISL